MEQVWGIRPFDSIRLYKAGIISGTEYAKFRYYQLKHIPETEFTDVIGLWEEQCEPLLLHVRLMHIDEDALQIWTDTRSGQDRATEESPGFTDALSDVEASLYCTRPELQQVIEFFEQRIGMTLVTANDSISHFKMLNRRSGDQPWTITRDPDQLYLFHPSYRYYPSKAIPHHDQIIAIISLPGWTPPISQGQVGHIDFFVFRHADLSDPAFDPYVTYGLGTITFDRLALRDFVILLRRL